MTPAKGLSEAYPDARQRAGATPDDPAQDADVSSVDDETSSSMRAGTRDDLAGASGTPVPIRVATTAEPLPSLVLDAVAAESTREAGGSALGNEGLSAVHLPRVSIVIPTLNEARNLPHVLPKIPADVYEVILVDGASTDGTVEVARSLLPDIRVVIEPRPGKGAALCAGFRIVEGDIIVMLDADGSTDPGEIPRFVQTVLDGADFAKGSRFLPNGGSTDISRLRAFGNRGFVVLVRVLFGGRYTDLCYGYNAFRTTVLPTLDLDGAGFEIETMMNVRALHRGLRITEVPSFELARIHGVSNLKTFRDGFRVLRTILRERLPRRYPVRTLEEWRNGVEPTKRTFAFSRRRPLAAVMDPLINREPVPAPVQEEVEAGTVQRVKIER